jgi:serine/threonine protein kinase
MTAHDTKGTTAAMNPSIPPAPESSPGRKSSIPDKSSPRQKQQQVEGVPSNSKSPADQDKQQQPRAPERVAETSSTPSTTANGSVRVSDAGGDGNGDVIGEYVLGETIGKGTFGKVKLGLHLLTGEKVAVKILEKKRIVQAADVERVAREIKILKRNRHPNVIQLYEVIDSPERIFLIMEHVDGGEMFEYIVAHHRIREPEAAFLFRQIVDGLAYLHSNEVTHRDLKPENLLLQSNRHHSVRQQPQQPPPSTLLVKIVDFGLSNMHDGGRLLRTACGSPCYAAPEMIQGRLYHGPVADMWSLGVVLFAMVCGFLPFEDSNTNLLYKKILSANYKMPTFLSANAQDLIRHILETDPAKRYTVDKIRQHPWLADVSAPDLTGFDVGGSGKSDEVKARHELVLNQLESLGLARDEIQGALAKKAYNRFTASYYLLDSKLQRIMRNRVIPVSVSGNTASVISERPVRRESNTATSDGRRQDRQQEPAAASADNEARVTASSHGAGSGKNIEVTATPRRQNSGASARVIHESPRRRSTPHHHHHPPPHESPYARRAVTPSNTASPRHSSHHEGSGVVQRPSSVRGGRNLVMINNSPAMATGAGYLPIAPNPPRDHRHSGILTARKPQGNTRVTISNGMVALRPLAQAAHAPRRELPPSTPQQSARRHSIEVPQHAAPPFRNPHDPTPTPMSPLVEPPHHAITSVNGGVVIRRRTQGPTPPPPTVHAHSPHQSPVTTTPATSSAHPGFVSKSDDTRSPQRIAPPAPANA